MSPQRLSTKAIIRICTVLIGVGLLVWLISYLYSTGGLSVKTDSGNQITIQQIRTKDGKLPHPGSYQKTFSTSKSVRVPVGTYSITSVNGQTSASQVVTVTAFKTVSITLNPAAIGAVEPVTDRAATSLVVGPTASFLDADNNNNLYTIGATGVETLVDSTHGFNTISWADPQYGITADGSGALYIVSGGVVTPLANPAGMQKTVYTSFAASSDHTLYMSDGTSVYVGKAGSAYKKIYTVGNSTVTYVLGAQGGSVLLKNVTTNNNASGDPDNTGQYVYINSAGQKYTYAPLAYEAALSPDGQHIALSATGSTMVFDNQFNKVIDIPAANVNAITWLTNTTILYGIGGGLWEDDYTTGHASELTNVSAAGSVSGITPDQTGSYIYFLIQHNGTGSTYYDLSRVGIKGETPTISMQQISVFLPNTLGQCNIGYDDFATPVIQVHGTAATQTTCMATAHGYLAENNFTDASIPVLFNSHP